MKLHYYRFAERTPGGANFGDDLNLWIWDRLLPGVFDGDGTNLFVGIGTLLRTGLPAAERTIVFSAGAGYGDPPQIDDTWIVYCVRGPLTARALGIDERKAVTDGAVLVRRLHEVGFHRREGYAFMPHVRTAMDEMAGWRAVCERAGIRCLDPRESVEDTLREIGSTEVLLTEAMHGAIVADALRVPWVPVVTSGRVLSFKWRDWTASLELDYEPRRIRCGRKFLGGLGSGAGLLDRARQSAIQNQLKSLVRKARPSLSDPAVLDTATRRMEECLEKFREDLQAGRFQTVMRT